MKKAEDGPSELLEIFRKFRKVSTLQNLKQALARAVAIGLLPLLGLFTTTLAQAQSFPNFTGPPTLVSGVALTQGAVYRYSNVIPNIDALVTLAQFSGVVSPMLNLDDNTIFPERFQPVITCAGNAGARECFIKFDFAFVQTATTVPVTVYGLVVSAQDVDGNGIANSAREFVEFTGAGSANLGTPTLLIAGTPVAGGLRFNQTNASNLQNGIGTGNQYEAYGHYTSGITGFSIIGGNVVGTAGCDATTTACQRQNSYTFLPVDSDVPSLTVRKISNGGTGTFSFSGDNGWVTQPVSTAVAGAAVTSQSEALLSPGVVTTLTEAAPAGFTLESINCIGLAAGGAVTYAVNGINGGSAVLNAAATAFGTLAAPTNIVCTFTNRKLAANLGILKSNATTGVVAGSTTTYTITATNNGPDSAAGTLIKDTASAGLNCSTVTCSSTAAGMCPAPSLPFASLSAGVLISPNFPAGSTATFVVTCGVVATGL